MLRRLVPHGLRAQILLWSLVPTMLILGVVAYFSFWAYSNVTEALVQDRNRELTRLLAGQMALELGEYAERLGDLRQAQLLGPLARSWSEILAEAGTDLRDFDGGVVVLDAHGTVIAADARRQDALGQDRSTRSYFTRLAASPAPLLLSNVEPDGPNGAPVVAMAVAMLDEQGTLSEVLVGMFSVNAHGSSAFYREMLRLNLREQTQLTIVDGLGVAIYHVDPQRVGRSVRGQPAVAAALQGPPGALRALDTDGTEVIASYAPIPGTTCYLVEQESWADLRALAYGYGRWLILILTLALVVPGIVVASALGLITRPIQRLTVAANAMSRGEMHQIVDSPMGTELGELASAFNRMAAQVQGLYSDLESRVRARTRELSAMNAIADVVSASLDLREILQAALAKVLELMAMDAGSAYRLAAGGDMLVLMARSGRYAEGLPEATRLPLALLTSREALSKGAIVIRTEELPEHDIWRTAQRQGWRQVVLVPLVSKDELLGVITLLAYAPRRIAYNELSLLTSIGNQIGVAMENGRLYQEAGRLAVMAERNRLAQDLHDSVTQTIFTASLLAGVIPLLWDDDPEDARRQLDEVARLTRGALAEMRALLLELRPATMAQVPLETLLARLAEATETNARLGVVVNLDADQPLPSRVRVALYRIAQEAINNVVKHAAAGRVWISLLPLPTQDAEPRGVAMEIRDDGLGFDLDQVQNHHLGLAIMHERAEDIHASLVLTTRPGQGTTVRVEWEPTPPGAHGGLIDPSEEDQWEESRSSWRISVGEGEGALDEDQDGY